MKLFLILEIILTGFQATAIQLKNFTDTTRVKGKKSLRVFVLFFTFLLFSFSAFSVEESYYEILEVSKTASPIEIKTAYKRQAMKWHPDRHNTEEDRKKVTKKMQKINKAYKVLRNPKKRQRYDQNSTDTTRVESRTVVYRVIDGKKIKGHLHPNGGGFVANTATVADTAYVGKDAMVLDYAKVLHYASISENAIVSGNVTVLHYAKIYGYARVSGNVKVLHYVKIYGYARVSGNVSVFHYAEIYGWTIVSDNVSVFHRGVVSGKANVSGDVSVFGNAVVAGEEKVSGKKELFGNALVFGYHPKVANVEKLANLIKRSNSEKLSNQEKISNQTKPSNNIELSDQINISKQLDRLNKNCKELWEGKSL